MAEALVSVLIEELASLALQRIEDEVRLVKNVAKDVSTLKSKLEAIQAVLEDAEKKQLSDVSVRAWLDKLKDVSHDMDDLLDEWNTTYLKFKIKKEDEDHANDPVQAKHKIRKEGEDHAHDLDLDQTKHKVRFPIRSPFSYFKSKVNRFTLRREIAHKIKDLKEKLDLIAYEKDRYMLNTTTTAQPVERLVTTSFIDETEIYGREEDKEIVMSKLLCENSTPQDKGLDIIPIVGMGGLGKTALAQLIYNDEKVKAHFDKLIWVCVSDPFEVMKVVKAIIEGVEGSAPNINELETASQLVRKCIGGKRFLLVLDDVWTKDNKKWEQLKRPLTHGASGSRIIVTTRKEEVAVMMGVAKRIITLEKLSEEHSWLVFEKRAFVERNEEECRQLEEIGRKIASKSKGLPLVAKTLGSLMCFKRTKTEWEDVLDSELWESADVEEIFTPFLLSYYELSAKEKRCFSYCSIFPKDQWINRDELIQLWMSQSYLTSSVDSEKEGRQCFGTLAMRSFFQDFQRINSHDGSITHCKMHDIVHDFAQFLTKNEFITMEVDNVEEKLKPVDERARHLTIVVGSNAQFPSLEYNKMNEKNLRTLFIMSGFAFDKTADTSLFLHLTCLRTLNLSYCGLVKIPDSICGLIHLRYLKLEGNFEMEQLPDTLCDLCNLQTLNLKMCRSLQRLPEGMRKLVNLRCLFIGGCGKLEGLPKEIGKLTGLQRLDTLIIPEDKEAYFDVGNLKMMKNLRLGGSLSIKGCENVGNTDVAEKLDLKNSHCVADLTLYFRSLEKQNGIEDDAAALELFEPPQNLVSLAISDYWGATMSPRWLLSLTNLREIFLVCCYNCETLPSFGKLPSLQKLDIYCLASLMKVGLEFLGITEKRDEEEEEEDGVITNKADSSKSPIISFPKLETLSFENLRRWVIWKASAAATKDSSIIMPCIARLEFKECNYLRTLPDFLAKTTSLKELSISSSSSLETWCQRRTGKEWAKISHVPNIQVNNKYVRKDGVWIQEANDLLDRPSTSE